jgi:hypothetical protein
LKKKVFCIFKFNGSVKLYVHSKNISPPPTAPGLRDIGYLLEENISKRRKKKRERE